MTTSGEKGRIIAVTITIGWVLAGSAILYSFVGRPDIGAGIPPGTSAPALPASGGLATALPEAPQPATNDASLADVDTMIGRLAARLEQSPDDVEGWQMLAWSHMSTQNYQGAVAAYGRAAALEPGNAELLSLYGEAIVRQNGGALNPQARELFETSLSIAPGNPRSLYFRGLALDQDGDTMAALTLWLGLYDRAPAGADWLPGLADRIRESAAAVGFDLSARPELARDAPLPAPAPAAPGPTPEQVTAAQDMSLEDQQSMIRGMVSNLAARLAENPDDAEGWVRLIRSYTVMGDGQAAGEALARAQETFADQPQELALIARMAAELGL